MYFRWRGPLCESPMAFMHVNPVRCAIIRWDRYVHQAGIVKKVVVETQIYFIACARTSDSGDRAVTPHLRIDTFDVQNREERFLRVKSPRRHRLQRAWTERHVRPSRRPVEDAENRAHTQCVIVLFSFRRTFSADRSSKTGVQTRSEAVRAHLT